MSTVLGHGTSLGSQECSTSAGVLAFSHHHLHGQRDRRWRRLFFGGGQLFKADAAKFLILFPHFFLLSKPFLQNRLAFSFRLRSPQVQTKLMDIFVL